MGNNRPSVAGMTCKVEGCDKPVRALWLCRAHHLRQWRYGDPLAGAPSRGHARQFILDHVSHQGDDCLTWPFALTPSGYGDVKFKGMEGMQAHRVMCVLAHGNPPTDQHHAAHSCGRGQFGCVNPKHLSWKTPKENIDDKSVHGTQPWGDQIHFAKITLPQARRAKYSRERGVDLAREFGVKPTTIYNIRAGRTWKGL